MPAKQEFGRIGVWTFVFGTQPAAVVRESARELEELGYGAIWFGEAFGRDAVSQAGLLLSATSRIAVATGIASIKLRSPQSIAAAERSLAEAYPGRFVLGLGGHLAKGQAIPEGYEHILGQQPGGPVATMRRYLDEMDAVPLSSPAPASPPARVLAALGPRMLELAAERTWGAHPYFVPVEHTARAREALGPKAFLGVEQAVVLDSDRSRGREVARNHVRGYVEMARHQRNNLSRLGFTEADLGDGGSDRLVDAIVAYGTTEVIRDRVCAHLDAGADHVCVQVLADDPMPTLRELTEVL